MRIILLLALCVGCQTAAPYEHQELANRAQAYAQEYGPSVENILGTRSKHKRINVSVAELEHGLVGLVNEEYDSIYLSPELRSRDDLLRWTVVHELAHVHMTGYWDTLSPELEEGVAESVAAQLLPHSAPTAEQQRSGIYKSGYDTVQRLGLDHLRGLAILARQHGLTEIPEAWLLPDELVRLLQL